MKKILIGISLLVSIVFVKNLIGQNNWEYWNKTEIRGFIKENLDFKVEPNLRYNQHFSNYYYTHLDFGINWKIKKWLILSPNYRHINTKKSDYWEINNRFYINATLKFQVFGVNLSERNQLAYQVSENEKYLIYKNKVKISPAIFPVTNVKPYIALEPFYNINHSEIYKNRFNIGLDFKIVNHFQTGLFYMIESRKLYGNWININILGTTMQYYF